MMLSVTNAQTVLDVPHARYILRDVFGATFVHATVDCSAENDFAVVYLDFDFRCVEITVAESIVDVFSYALV